MTPIVHIPTELLDVHATLRDTVSKALGKEPHDDMPPTISSLKYGAYATTVGATWWTRGKSGYRITWHRNSGFVAVEFWRNAPGDGIASIVATFASFKVELVDLEWMARRVGLIPYLVEEITVTPGDAYNEQMRESNE